MLGRVAQGAAGVAKNVFLADATKQLVATSTDESEVEFQLQRISDALMPEYRREAVAQLKDLLQDNPKVCVLSSPTTGPWSLCSRPQLQRVLLA